MYSIFNLNQVCLKCCRALLNVFNIYSMFDCVLYIKINLNLAVGFVLKFKQDVQMS